MLVKKPTMVKSIEVKPVDIVVLILEVKPLNPLDL